MDEYWLLVDGLKNKCDLIKEHIQSLKIKAFKVQNSETPLLSDVHDILKLRKKKIFASHLVIDSSNDSNNSSASWSDVNHKIKCCHGNMQDISTKIGKLSDDLPLPGSCLLNIVWFGGFDKEVEENMKNVVPLLGSLKKLVLWNWASFVLLSDKVREINSCIPYLIKCYPTIIPETTFVDIIKNSLNHDEIWKGSLVMLSEGKKQCRINNMQLLMQHETPHNKNNMQSVNQSFVWFNKEINGVELVDIQTVPIFLLSGKEFVLQLSYESEDSKYFQELLNQLLSMENAALLCNLDYCVSAEEFVPTPEFTFNAWKTTILNNPQELEQSSIKLHCKPTLLHMLLVPQTNTDSKKALRAILLHPLNTLLSQLCRCIEPDKIFKNPESYSPELADTDSSTWPELNSLKNRCKNDVDIERKFVKTKSNDSIRKSSCRSKTQDMFLSCSDVLKSFNKTGKLKAYPYLNHKTVQPPSKNELSDFSTALQLNYHGLFFNKDEDLAEKKDRNSRRMINQLVRFETASLASLDKVPSPSAMFVEESPGKFIRNADRTNSSKNNEQDKSKQRKLQKVAEKLYQKRLQNRGRTQSKSFTRSTSSMVLRSTPKKNNPLLRRKSTMDLYVPNPESVINKPTNTKKIHQTYVQRNKQRLHKLIKDALLECGVDQTHSKFQDCSKKLYDVSMTYLKDLKSSKGLDIVMKLTVTENVSGVLRFFELT